MLKKIYNILLKTYGYQGWWPIQGSAGHKGFDKRGYHAEDYAVPVSFKDKFEVIAGAILTQNTAWLNVEKAIRQLSLKKLLTPRNIADYPADELAALVKASGYFNQKAKKLKAIAGYLLENKLTSGKTIPTRESLLQVWGVGAETADSILLYAYQVPVFVVDAYTKRIFSRIGLAGETAGYNDLQQLFQKKLPKEYTLYNEYHALLVFHGKEVCRVKPLCSDCCLKNICREGRIKNPC